MSYERDTARIEGSDNDALESQRTRFRYDLIEVKASVPLMFRIKRGGFPR